MTVPSPETGLIVHFNYLWGREQTVGLEEARYPRPCLIVVCSPPKEKGAGPKVMVVPITHSSPRSEQTAIEIPAKVREHLGLDGERSWIVTDEVNVFEWPGFDLAPMRSGFVYGLLPSNLFEQVRKKLLDAIGASRLVQVAR